MYSVGSSRYQFQYTTAAFGDQHLDTSKVCKSKIKLHPSRSPTEDPFSLTNGQTLVGIKERGGEGSRLGSENCTLQE